MRFVTRTLAFVLVILAAFWFTAENAGELVNIDLAFASWRTRRPAGGPAQSRAMRAPGGTVRTNQSWACVVSTNISSLESKNTSET